MTFYTWLLKQTDLDDPIGDLANDAKRDKNVPKEGGFDEWDLYLHGTAAHEAFLFAWEEYERSKKR